MTGCSSSSSSPNNNSRRSLLGIIPDTALPTAPTSMLLSRDSLVTAANAFPCNSNVYKPTDSEVIKKLYCRRRRRRRRRQWQQQQHQQQYIGEVQENGDCIEDDHYDHNIDEPKKTPTKYNSVRLRHLLKYILLYMLFFSLPCIMAQQLDCCLPENTDNGMGCSGGGTEIGGEKYLCVPINTNECIYCNKREDIEVSQCSTGCVVAKLRYFCSGRFDPSTRHALFGFPAAAQHATELAQHPLGDAQLPQLRGTLMN